jgi:type III restriction enzyme
MELNNYQCDSLDALGRYLRSAARFGAKVAFIKQTGRPYVSVRQLPGLPYVCLRIPTGGGKTFMACNTLGIVAKEYLHVEHGVYLWLVPSTAILEQTLAALRDRMHPYRQAIDAQFNGRVAIMDLGEALYVQRTELQGKTCIIVSTFQAMRVEETEGRKIYESTGALQHHFTGLSPELESRLERQNDGVVPNSLANVLRLWRPVVIMDEAHNARTPLAFDTLARFNPSCIIEFTATPETRTDPDEELFASNILYHVSAAELKLEHMVKLPIKLDTRSNWKLAIGDAVRIQRMLEQAAVKEKQKTGEYIRPIVLLQAQPTYQKKTSVTVDVVRQSLIEDFRIPEEQIKRATGDAYEIANLNLLAPDCPVRFIITVAALKEGWDCAFAYVLCTVSEIGTSRAVEQILGRILRMPHATKKDQSALNCAYAVAASQPFAQAATSLKETLIECCGFQRLEADQLVSRTDDQQTFQGAGIMFPEFEQKVTEKPDLNKLPDDLRDRVTFDEERSTLIVADNVTESDKAALAECFTSEEDKKAVETIYHHSQGHFVKPQPPRPPFRVPMLMIRVDGQLELFEEDHFLGGFWKLTDYSAALSESEYPSVYIAGESVEIDVSEQGRLEIRHAEQVQQQLRLLVAEPGGNIVGLTNWLDRQIPHRDILRADATHFIHRVLTELMESRKLSIEQLDQEKFRLCNAIADKIRKHREEHRHSAFTQLLLPVEGEDSDFEVDPAIYFELSEDQYAPNQYYSGSYKFKKHHFTKIGDFDTDEECDCGWFIDQMEEVDTWIRNVPRKEGSLFFPTPGDRFYPDFVVRLKDGRFLLVEYKGKHLWDSAADDRLVGDLWADSSKGSCVFVMVTNRKWTTITAAIQK